MLGGWQPKQMVERAVCEKGDGAVADVQNAAGEIATWPAVREGWSMVSGWRCVDVRDSAGSANNALLERTLRRLLKVENRVRVDEVLVTDCPGSAIWI